MIGDLVAPPIALAGFFVLAVFYGFTSHGLTGLPAVVRRDQTGADRLPRLGCRLHQMDKRISFVNDHGP